MKCILIAKTKLYQVVLIKKCEKKDEQEMKEVASSFLNDLFF